jgi:hypothetical protein
VVVSPVQDRNGDFSPDGKRLAFISDRDGVFRTYIVARVGDGWGEPKLLRKDGLGGHWSPDGKYMTTFDTAALYVFRADALDSAPQYVFPWDSLIDVDGSAWAADSRGIFERGRHRTLGQGIWLQTLSPPATRLVLRVDDPTLDFGAGQDASVTHLYFLITRRESDIWTAEMVSR